MFIKTGYEEKVINEINGTWKMNEMKPFIPLYDMPFKRYGIITIEKRRFFPGYIIIESEMPGVKFVIETRDLIERSRNMFRILKYGDDYQDSSYEMNEEERSILLKLFNANHCVEISKGYYDEGNNIVITEGPFMGHEGCIKKVNRHKMEAVINIDIMGSTRELKVGFELIQKR